MSFGSNLERIRKDKNISQAQLGKALGLTQQMVSSYEKDTSSPNIEVLVKIADFFHVSLDSLVGHIPPIPEANSSESRFLRYFQELNSSDREKCIMIIRAILEDRELMRKKKKYKKEQDAI